MRRSIEYYQKRIKIYKNLSRFLPALSDYFYILEKSTLREIPSSKEYHIFNEIYNEILTILFKYMDKLDVATIEEIFAYNLIVKNKNYLAYERLLEDSYTDLGINELSILSPIALNNHGKCRHDASLACDLLKYRKFEAIILTGILQKPDEEFIDASSSANHGITLATDKTFSYLLDTTHNRVFNLYANKTFFSADGTSFKESTKDRAFVGDKFYQLHYKHNLEKPLKDLYLCLLNIDKSITRLLDHESVFEDMHKELKGLLEYEEEIYQRIIKR